MPVLSFRVKLVLAMMLVVAGVSVTTLFITQRRVQGAYEKTFRNQFERQINYFTGLQETRLGTVKEQCLKLSQSAPLLIALEQERIDPETLYGTASNELRIVLVSAFQEARMAGNTGPRKITGTFFRFLDARGKPIEPPDNLRRQLAATGYAKRLIEQKVDRVRGALDSPER